MKLEVTLLMRKLPLNLTRPTDSEQVIQSITATREVYEPKPVSSKDGIEHTSTLVSIKLVTTTTTPRKCWVNQSKQCEG